MIKLLLCLFIFFCFSKVKHWDYQTDFYIYTYDEDELISNAIDETNHWGDCIYFYQLFFTSGLYVDVGANIGSCSLHMAKLGYDVIAFEPVSSNYFLFEKSIKKNKIENIKAYNFALGDKEEKNIINVDRSNMGHGIISQNPVIYDMRIGEYLTEEIVIKKMDDIIDRHINFLKMDVQGYEMKVLQGAENLLSNNMIDTIKFEFCPDMQEAVGTTALDLLKLLALYKYTIYNPDLNIIHEDYFEEYINGFNFLDSVDLIATKIKI